MKQLHETFLVQDLGDSFLQIPCSWGAKLHKLSSTAKSYITTSITKKEPQKRTTSVVRKNSLEKLGLMINRD